MRTAPERYLKRMQDGGLMQLVRKTAKAVWDGLRVSPVDGRGDMAGVADVVVDPDPVQLEYAIRASRTPGSFAQGFWAMDQRCPQA